MSRRPPNRSKDEPSRGKCSEKKRELQASLHSRKERKRRLQIKTSCQHLSDLLPFVKGQLDTATTLELTARYMSYLKETLPPHILSKVNKAVEENASCSRKNVQRPQKKRRTIRLKRNTSQRPKLAPKKSTEDHASRRCTQQKICEQVNQPALTISYPLTMDQMLPAADDLTTMHARPILLDKSAVPRGQMLPVCQNQFASFQSVENNWMNPASALMNPVPCAFTSAMISHTFLPQIDLHPSSSHVSWDVTPGLVDPVAFPSVNLGQAYSPPEQTTETNTIIPAEQQSQIDSPLVGLTECHFSSAEDFTSQPLVLSPVFQNVTSSSEDLTPEDGNQPVTDAVCGSRLLQENDLCSSSPLTDSSQDVVNPFWLDLLLDTNGNLCFPDANLVNIVLSPYSGSN
ncbi:Spermatogenesis- and oogenesis-specific basic helix-loop-helix-containing protein 2 [Larimichthys crocea]|uniref:Spermatogenesis-and oogenesis-specific basic helix-loop-helix-containing protein 2 n=2 Tax=Larimichthys crocea TaxID=215358 RepID=A0A6G0IU86_LARCR|nr:Spermatogenesis- and oogenesis-specific basic helix-loop-helix-containing protein 2 [Larimichthys crocea]